MKTFFLAAVVLMSGLSQARDVLPQKLEKGATHVRIAKKGNGSIEILKCRWKMKNSCSLIGNRSLYSINELQNLRHDENWQVAGSVVGDVIGAVIVVASGGTALGFGAGAGVGGLSAFGTGIVVTGTATAVGGTAALFTVDAFNPHEQYKQGQTLREEILADKDVVEEKIEVFIERLALVLSKI